MVSIPLAFGRVPLTLLAAAFLLLQLRLPSSVVVVAEKLILHDIQVAQQQFHQEQLQQLQRSSSSSSSSSSTQLLSATIKIQLFRVSSTIKPYQRTLLANALHKFFDHVFDDARQDVYKLDITHVAVYEEKLLKKATMTTDGDENRNLVLNSLQASQLHIQQARSGGGAEVEVDDIEAENGDDGYDDEYYDDGSEFMNNNDDDQEIESKEVVVAPLSQTMKSDSGSGSGSDSDSDSSLAYVLSFATFISAKDSSQPESSLSQEGEFEMMLIHVCHKFSSHLVEFVHSVDDDYFTHVTNAMVSGFEDDELREKEIEDGKITLESKMVSSTSGSRLNVVSIVAILLCSVSLVLAVVKVRRTKQRRNINRLRCHEISSSNANDASSSIKSLQILYNKPTNDNYYDDDYSFDPLGTNTGYNNNDYRNPSWSSRYDEDNIISNEKFSSREEYILSRNTNNLYQESSANINVALEEHQHVYAPPGKVGVAIDVIDGNPVVHKIKRGSPLEGLLQPKDIVIAIDDVDTTCMSAADVTQLMVKRMKFDRKITFVRRK